MIDCGVTKEFFLRERHRAYEAASTPNCKEKCSGCGANKLADPEFCRWCPGHPGGNEIESITGNAKEVLVGEALIRQRQRTNPKPVRSIRARFSKHEPMLYISHLDLAKCVSKAIVKSGIPVWYTEGFNPIPHLVFSPPLSVGCGGDVEVLDFKVITDVSDEELFEKLSAAMPNGITLREVYTQNIKLKTIAWGENEIEFHHHNIKEEDISRVCDEIATTFDSPVVLMKRSKSGEKEVDISPLVKRVSARVDGDTLYVTAVTSASGENYLNPEYVAKALENKFAISNDKTYHYIMRRRLLLADGVTDFN